MSRARERADRIRSEIPITQVLIDYGYPVRPWGGDREQQFPCNLHGDGQDNRPSARVYPDSSSWYCWTCGRSRDAISTVMEKEGTDFSSACRILETRYGLPVLPWADDIPRYQSLKVGVIHDVYAILHSERIFADVRQSIHDNLQHLTDEHEFTLSTITGMWNVFDMISCQVKNERSSEDQGKEGMLKLWDKALTMLREGRR